MACYYPIEGWHARNPSSSGKIGVVFDANRGQLDSPIRVPCGRCIGCRLDRSRDWATRCVHEAQMHNENCFITLTYDPESLPRDQSLNREHLTRFFKRLRFDNSGKKIRYFACGEYGENQEGLDILGRAHYHAILFGHEFQDKELMSQKRDHPLYTSETLKNLWGKGHVSIGNMCFDTAAYTARYALKKINGEQAEEHYKSFNLDTGESVNLKPEFLAASNRPGIGKPWFDKYKNDLRKGFVTVNGNKVPVPKYYFKLFDQEDDKQAAQIKENSALHQAEKFGDYEESPNRLRVKEEVKKIRTKTLERTL